MFQRFKLLILAFSCLLYNISVMARSPIIELGMFTSLSSIKSPTKSTSITTEITLSEKQQIEYSPSLAYGAHVTILYPMSAERIIGLQVDFSQQQLKEIIGPKDTTVKSSSQTQEEDPDSNQTLVIPKSVVRFIDIMGVLRNYQTTSGISLSLNGGVSKCTFSPTHALLKTKLGYVVSASTSIRLTRNLSFGVSVKYRVHNRNINAEKEGIDQTTAYLFKNMKSLNTECGLSMTF